VNLWPFSFPPVLFAFALAFMLTACNKAEIKEPIEYTGPLKEFENFEMFYTEKDIIKVKLTAPLVYEFKNSDRECPKGIYIEFYDEFGQLESTLKANHAYFFNATNQWRGRGAVEVKNIQKNDQLNTEELFWKQSDKRIFTEKFVTIRQQGDIWYGTGLDAKEDLSEYTINDIKGEMHLEE
jgi:LPS export ABC transporter protein LptC